METNTNIGAAGGIVNYIVNENLLRQFNEADELEARHEEERAAVRAEYAAQYDALWSRYFLSDGEATSLIPGMRWQDHADEEDALAAEEHARLDFIDNKYDRLYRGLVDRHSAEHTVDPELDAAWRDYEAFDALAESLTANGFMVAEMHAPMTPPGAAKRVPPKVVSGTDFVAGFRSPDWLVDSMMQRGYLYSLTGQTGHGKTAVTILVARSVEHGNPLGEHDVERGRVLYLAGENPDDIRARMILSAEVYGLPITDNINFIASTFDIERDFAVIAREAERSGGFDLVIVDTLAAYFRGDDENSNTQLGEFARTLRRFTSIQGGPAVIVNCHPTKVATRENMVPRGGGSFLAEVDGNLTLWAADDRKATQLHHHQKFRGPGFEPITFKLETRTSAKLIDSKGREMPSVVARCVTDSEAARDDSDARSDENALLDMMLGFASGSYSTWCQSLGWVTAKGAPNKSRISRAMSRLERDKLVKKVRGEKWALTPAGRKEAEDVVLRGSAPWNGERNG